MKMLPILLFLLSLNSAFARVSLELVTENSSVKQGEIISGKLLVTEASGTAALAGLKGQNLAKTLYVMNLSPFMGKNGQLESEVKVIFSAVPKSNSVSEVLNGEETVISWKNINVEATEASQSFLFEDFSIPETLKLMKWFILLITLVILIVGGLWIKGLFNRKQSFKTNQRNLKAEILSCKDYDDVVIMWRQKKKYVDAFPATEEHFKNLEKVLFKYQFKQSRSEHEVALVVSAYQEFKSNVMRDLNGV